MSEVFNINSLRKFLFWDLNIEKLNINNNKTIIIERVFNRGDIDDIKNIIKYYGKIIIKKEIVKAGFLDKKTLNFASIILRIPKKQFQCYSKIQSKHIHWNF